MAMEDKLIDRQNKDGKKAWDDAFGISWSDIHNEHEAWVMVNVVWACVVFALGLMTILCLTLVSLA